MFMNQVFGKTVKLQVSKTKWRSRRTRVGWRGNGASWVGWRTCCRTKSWSWVGWRTCCRTKSWCGGWIRNYCWCLWGKCRLRLVAKGSCIKKLHTCSQLVQVRGNISEHFTTTTTTTKKTKQKLLHTITLQDAHKVYLTTATLHPWAKRYVIT